MKNNASFLGIFMGICLVSYPSFAAKVVNLTEQPQAIVLLGGSEPQLIEIAPNGQFSRLGPVRFKYRNHELYVEENMEYAIWPGNLIGPQRTNGNFFRGR